MLCCAQEVHLLCKGKIKWLGNERVEEKIYEITFDEKRGTLPSFTVGLAQGCFQSEIFTGTCNCSVTNSSISCESKIKGIKNPAFESNQSFIINRYTGRMQTSVSTTANENYYSSNSGEFVCEKFTSKKF